jgi:hypothetical protein
LPPTGDQIVELATIARWMTVFESKVRNAGGVAFLEHTD